MVAQKNIENFVHLHNHTEYSLLDGAVRVNHLIEAAKKNNMSAVAMTDHGVLYGLIKFYRQAKKSGIKPILGCELYLAPESRFEKKSPKRYHLVLLAANNEGYNNLLKIVSKAWLQGFYYKPRADKDLLYEHNKGIIALSACVLGEIPQLLLEGKKELAKKAVSDYQQIFGKNNFYLELQDHKLREEKRVNGKMISLANELDVPLVVTNDIHYLNQDDAEFHEILLALQTGKTINDEDRLTFDSEEFYFKNHQEMKKLFPEINEAYSNTKIIADRCNVELDFDQFYLPDYPGVDENQKPEELLYNKCIQGLKNKELVDDQKAKKRLEYELNIIKEMDYVSYFLIVRDFIVYAEEKGIRVGPGRGSAAGSLVSYLLGITKINPLKYGLIFERFLNPERVTMPDIDIDFDERRDQIIEYVKKRYGKEKVAQIGTFGTMAARAAVRDIGRALDIPYSEVDRIAKMIPSTPGITLKEALEENEKLKKQYDENQRTKKLLDYARQVEGMPRHISTHAAGVIIGPEKLTNIIPLQFQDENIITQLPMDELEELGLLKMDFLGLRNLTVIEKTLDLIENKYNKKINIDNIPLDDMEVYKLLQEGKTLGVFQMESYLFQDLNKKLKPDRFEDLIALLALGRPGPLNSGLVEDYIESRHGNKQPEYLHPSLKPILEETFGLILYQEQVMEIASKLGGYSMGEADILRRGMSKKKPGLVARERKKFIKGAQNNGLDKKTAHEIFDQMEYFAGYGFNKSHSAAYALLAYQTAYLKVKYPSEFMAALLSSVMNNLDKISVYINGCKEMGINVLPPDINESGYEFETNENGDIRFGLKAVKNIGSGAIKSITEERENGYYQSPVDFLKRVDLTNINIKTLESLIKSGTMDSLGIYRSRLLVKYEEIYNRISSWKKKHSSKQTSFFDLFEEDSEFFEDEIKYPSLDELSIEKKLDQEKEFLGIYISGHPLEIYEKKIRILTNSNCDNVFKKKNIRNKSLAGVVISKKEHITKRNNKMAFLTIEDQLDQLDVVVFPDVYNIIDFPLEKGNRIIVNGYCQNDSFIVKNIIPLDIDYLEIIINNITYNKVNIIKKLLVKNNGNIPVFLRKKTKEKDVIIYTPQKYWIDNYNKIEKELKKILKKDYYNLY